MKLPERIAQQARKEYSVGARLAAIAAGSLIFAFGIPALLLYMGRVGGEAWQFRSPRGLSAIAVGLVALGLGLALWTTWVQFCRARGTPVPVIATKKLLTAGPYALCRNPMILGVLLAYLGTATLAASFLSLLTAFLVAALVVAEVKFIEEKELALRFGDVYLQYKQSTPFIVPRFGFRGKT